MTTSIRLSIDCSDIALNDGINALYYDTIKHSPDEIATCEAIHDYITRYIDEHLPDNITWFPYLCEAYVEINEDPEEHQDKNDDRSIEDLIIDLSNEAMRKIDEILEADENAFDPETKT